MLINVLSKSDGEWIRILSRYWKIDEVNLMRPFKVLAKFKKSPKNDKNNREFGYFEEVRNLNGDLLYFPMRLGRVRIWSQYRKVFDNDEFWLINVSLSPFEERVKRNNPFMLKMDNYIVGKPKLQFVDKLKKEKLIRTIFEETGATARDAKNTSRALHAIMGDLYTETERFVYELLQNADDQPQENSLVNVTLKILSENFLFLHTGKPFTEEDVESLSSIGDSTKANDSEKTGYKGIGFKSVFSDAETVYIDSGNFSFAFDKHSPLYPSDANMDDIPWQIKPIWQERYRLPQEVQDEQKFFTSPVGIALQVGNDNIIRYGHIIPNLLSHPRFALFLRNIGRIFYEQGESNVIEIKKSTTDNVVSLTQSKDSIESTENWIIKDFIIPIPDETHDALQSEKLVPSKLKEARHTKISFAVKVNDGKIEPVEDAVLYTYLPTKVDDYGFKFLINADFLTTASRESIHVKNIWNRFLFENIGHLLVEWIASLKEFDDVLTLLPMGLMEEENILWNDFFKSYKDALHTSAFIKGHNGINVTLNDVILDETGLSHIIGEQLLCDLIDTQKVLPKSQQDQSVLSNEIFGDIETIEFDDIIDELISNEKFNQWLIVSSEADKEKLYNWINENDDRKRHSKLCQLVANLPLLLFGSEKMSFNDVDQNDYVVTTEEIKPIKNLLERIGFTCSDNEFTEQHLLYNFISPQDSASLFESISESDFSSLDPKERKELFLGLKEITGIGEAKLKAIPLFRNIKGNFKPLGDMINFREETPEWLSVYVLNEEDVFDETQTYLIRSEDEFKEIIQKHFSEFNVSLNELYNIYKNEWTSQFTKSLMDTHEAKDVLPIVEESDSTTKVYFLNRLKRIDLLSNSNYKVDSYEYRVLQMAVSFLDEPSSFSRKVFYDDKRLSEFTVSNDVICEWEQEGEKKRIKLSLAKILPQYQNVSDAIEKIKNLFEKKSGLDKLFEARPMDLHSIIRALEAEDSLNLKPGSWPTDKQGNAIQYLFYVYYYRAVKNYTSSWVISIKLENETESFVFDMLDFLHSNKLDISKSPFTYRIISYFKNKAFYNDYLLENEQLLPVIEQWADSEDKKLYLKKNGVRDASHRSINCRKLFSENLPIETIDKLSESEISSFLAYISPLSEAHPFTGENQKAALLYLKDEKRSGLVEKLYLTKLQDESIEMNSTEYTKWLENHYPSIFIYQGDFPVRLYYQEYPLIEYTDEQQGYYYDKPNKCLYICGNKAIDELLFEAARDSKTDLDLDDYQQLCMSGKVLMSSDEIDEKDRRIQELERQIEEMLANESSAKIAKGSNSPLSNSEKYEAQLEAQRFLIEQMPHWEFPDGYGESKSNGMPKHFSTVSAEDENGNVIPFVLKSYKIQSEPFKINPQEWDFIIKKNAHLFIYDGYLIREIEPMDLIMNQSNISITFSTENLDIEDRIDAFANALHYFTDLHFDFESFNISKRAKSIKALFNTVSGKQQKTSDEDL